MSRARDLANVADDVSTGTVVTTASPSLGRRNLIINGAMQVAQRGTSGFTIGASSEYTLDRQKSEKGGSSSARFAITQSTDAPDGFGNSLKWDCTTADASIGSSNHFYQTYNFEGQDLQQLKHGTSSAENMTLSFWVKSNVTGTYNVWLYKDDSGRHSGKQYTINSANTWEHKTLTISGDTSGAIQNDNTKELRLTFYIAAGTDYTSGTSPDGSWQALTAANRAPSQVNLASDTANEWYLTGVQLEVGSVATPFEHRSYGEELALCQRYFVRKYNAAGGNALRIGVGGWGNSTTGRIAVFLSTEMRSRPTVTAPSVAYALQEYVAWRAITTISSADSDNNYIDIAFNVASSTAAQGDIAYIGNGGGGDIDYQFDAEL